MLCAAVPATRIEEYKEHYRECTETDRGGKDYPLDILQSSEACTDFEVAHPGTCKINKMHYCKTTGIAHFLVEVLGIRSVHGAPALGVSFSCTHLPLKREVARPCCDSLFVRAHSDKFAEMQARGKLNDPRVQCKLVPTGG